MAREIVLDTETTGFDAQTGDRIVEIGCVELINHVPTGKTLHLYVNPQRDVPEDAFRVHGLSTEFLSDKPLFKDIAHQFLTFIGESTLVIHNAPFDMGFLNTELGKAGRNALKNPVVDTVLLAREKHPGSRVNLDALCRMYNIDNTKRTLHGALLDSEILAEVYMELLGGRQSTLLNDENPYGGANGIKRLPLPTRPKPYKRDYTEAERIAHEAYVAEMGDKAIWLKYKDDVQSGN